MRERERVTWRGMRDRGGEREWGRGRGGSGRESGNGGGGGGGGRKKQIVRKEGKGC